MNKWTDQEKAYICQHYHARSCARISADLGRPYSSTSSLIQQLIKQGDLTSKRPVSAYRAPRIGQQDDFDPSASRELVIGEVEYMIEIGHRPHDANQIRAGIQVAKRDLTGLEWHRLAHRTLEQLCDDFYHYGHP